MGPVRLHPQAGEAGNPARCSVQHPGPGGFLPVIALCTGKCQPGGFARGWAAGDCCAGVSPLAGLLSPCYKTAEKPPLLEAGGMRYHGEKQIKKLGFETKR